MEFRWNDFLTYAKTYINAQSDQTQYRCAVSRAYYAAYHAADNYAQNSLDYTPSGSKHKSLWKRFQECDKKEFRKISTIGNALKLKREYADYHEIVNNNMYVLNSEDVQDICDQVDEILRYLSRGE